MAYERSLDDERNGRVNHYTSSEEFFKRQYQNERCGVEKLSKIIVFLVV